MCQRRFLAVMTLAVLSITGCVPQGEFELGRKFFNPRLRADLQPLRNDQMPAVASDHPAYFARRESLQFSAGGPGGDELVSPLFPLLPNGYDANRYRNAKCYWKPQSENVALRWELVVPFMGDNVAPEDGFLGTCFGSGGIHPYDRRQPLKPPGSYALFDADLALLRQVILPGRAVDDGLGACEPEYFWHAMEVQPAPLSPSQASCVAASTRYVSGCMVDGCEVSASIDTTYVVQAEDYERVVINWAEVEAHVTSGATTPPPLQFEGRLQLTLAHQLGPRVKVVSGVRTLRRRLERAVSAPNRYVYGWRTPTLADGRWEDNFSPLLFTHKVRVLVKRGHSVSYLLPQEVVIGSFACAPSRLSFEQDKSVIGPCASLEGGGYTPTYIHTAPEDKLGWVFEFSDDPLLQGLSEFGYEVQVPHGQLWVEFVVAETALDVERALYAPGQVELGQVAEGLTRRAPVLVENTSPYADILLQSVQLTGDNVADYDVELPSGIALPYRLGRRQGIALTVIAKPTRASPLAPHATLELTASDVGGGVQLHAATALVYTAAAGAWVHYLPEFLALRHAQDGSLPPEAYARGFIIGNHGSLAVQRQPIEIVDATPGSGDAQAFRIVSSPDAPWDQAATLEPGEHHGFGVRFEPRSPGRYEAEIVVSHDGDTDTVVIRLSGEAI